MPRNLLVALLVFAAVTTTTTVLARKAVPPTSRTGAPGVGTFRAETTCNSGGCHSGNPIDGPNGAIEILGLPEEYLPGVEYAITVRLSSTETQFNAGRLWGFQAVILESAGGTSVGTIAPNGLTVTNGFASLSVRRYVSHNSAQLKTGAQSPVEWSFQWTAPPEGTGEVGIYASGNAANGLNGPSGDHIYTGSAAAAEGAMSPVRAVTWGEVKRRHTPRPAS